MKKLVFFLFACLLTFSSNARADEGDAQSSSSTNTASGSSTIQANLEEIVVTARKREERLLDIPESVVAIQKFTKSV